MLGLFERKHFKNNAKNFLDSVQKEIVELGRLHAPFESIIDKASITLDDLNTWSNLSIEMPGQHDASGRLIVSSGSPDNSGYDWPEFEEDMGSKPGKFSPARFFAKYKERRNFLKYKRLTQKFTRESIMRRRIKQPYIVHNHPGIYTDTTSTGDLNISNKSKTDIDVILSHGKAIFYKTPSAGFGKELIYTNIGSSTQDIEGFIKANGITYFKVDITDYNDTKAQMVLKFMQGKIKWRKLHKFLS